MLHISDIIERARLGAEEGKPLSEKVLCLFLTDSLGSVPKGLEEEMQMLLGALECKNYDYGIYICAVIKNKGQTIPYQQNTTLLASWIGMAYAYFESLQRTASKGVHVLN